MEDRGRPFEHEEDEHHGPNEEHGKLHGDLGHCIEQQAQAALRDALTGKVALHLALVAAEVGKRKKHAADQAAPQVVAVVQVKLPDQRIELVRRAGDCDCIRKMHVGRQQQKCREERGHQACRQDDHVEELGPRDGGDATLHRVEHDDCAHGGCGDPLGPAQDDRHHHSRRCQRHADTQPTLDQEYRTDQCPRLGVKALLQILVSRVDLGAVIDWHRDGRDENHRNREPEVELHEAHTVDVTLASGGDECDGAGLRRHDGQRHGVPRHLVVGEHEALRRLLASAAPQAIEDD